MFYVLFKEILTKTTAKKFKWKKLKHEVSNRFANRKTTKNDIKVNQQEETT